MRDRIATGFILLVTFGLGGLVIWAFIRAVLVEPAIAGSIGVAVVGVLGVVWQQRQTEKARLREAHRVRMQPVYDELLRVIWTSIAGGADESDPEIEEFFRDFKSRHLTLGASSKMVQAFNQWTDITSSAVASGNNVEVMDAWEFLLRAIRDDWGHDDSNLPDGELLRLFISDYDELKNSRSVI